MGYGEQSIYALVLIRQWPESQQIARTHGSYSRAERGQRKDARRSVAERASQERKRPRKPSRAGCELAQVRSSRTQPGLMDRWRTRGESTWRDGHGSRPPRSSAQEAQLVSRRKHVARTRGERHVARARRKGTQRGRAEMARGEATWRGHVARARGEGTRREDTWREHVGAATPRKSGQASRRPQGGGRSVGRGHHGAQRRRRSSCHGESTRRGHVARGT